ncbi:ABC transporter permease [Thiomicrorhabdus sp.]|uniref:ABC transporter permease n=1 Tax=Thiomicrorhabdus sp. TaxID=2039724 RepID=UPI0029C84AE9|nr:FtsX-like permease family protein [Thiomicrorhabdus sp.]
MKQKTAEQQIIPIHKSGNPALINRFAWRNLWRNPRRSLILILVTALGLMSSLFFYSLMQAWAKSMLDHTLNSLSGEVQLHAPHYQDNPDVEHSMLLTSSQLTQLKSLPIRDFSAHLKLPAMIKSEYETYPVLLLGVEPQTGRPLDFIRKTVHQGQFLNQDSTYQIVIGAKLAKRLNTDLGRKVVLMSQGNDGKLKEIGLTIVGLYRHSDPNAEASMVFADLKTVQNWLDIDNKYSEITLNSSQPLDIQQILNDTPNSPLNRLKNRLKQAFPELDVQTWQSLQPFANASIKMMDSFNWVWIAMILVLMLFGMINTLLMSLYERRREFTTLYTIGLKSSALRWMLLLELVWILAIALLVSWGAMIALIASVSDGIDLGFLSEGAAWFGVDRILYLNIEWQDWFDVSAAMVVTLIMIAAVPIWRSTRVAQLKPSNRIA